jgi:hypothetical protein
LHFDLFNLFGIVHSIAGWRIGTIMAWHGLDAGKFRGSAFIYIGFLMRMIAWLFTITLLRLKDGDLEAFFS